MALADYEKNTRLCEAFYSPLQGLEVALRNSVHSQMRNKWGPYWMNDGGVQLGAAHQTMATECWTGLLKRHNSPTHDNVVAELRFAFWVGLLGPSYDATLWRQAVHKAFRASGSKKRSHIHSRFNAIRRFRNRVAHHEPIFHKNLRDRHDEILEAIGWICHDTRDWVSQNSRVIEVLAAE